MIANLSKRPMDSAQAGVLNAALMLFLHWDFKEVSVKQIISAAGVSKGGFYKFYANKNELLLDLLLDEVFHIDQWVEKNESVERDHKLVKRYFLMIGRHLERYQLHQKIEMYLEGENMPSFLLFKKWKKNHRLWIKHQLLKGRNELDMLYANIWSLLEGCALLNTHPHFQYLSGKRQPFEYFVQQIDS